MAAPLVIETLGRFRVMRGDRPLTGSDFGRDKAVQLLQYFITHPHSLTHKAKLLDELWPELPEAKAERDFKVAFYALNQALEPERESRSTAVYLERQGQSYGLNREAPITIDYLDFERALTAHGTPEARRAQLAAALARYGEYLPEQLLADWTAATRERLSSLFLVGATELATLELEAGNLRTASYWCERIIAQDSYWEAAYRLLMQLQLKLGNRPKVLALYRQLEQVLRSGLGLAPMPETTALYRAALGEGA